MNTELKIVITGHIDHGKSTLIGRILYDTKTLPGEVQARMEGLEKGQLTATFASLLDQLQEEIAEEKTIDTTCMYFKTEKKSYVIIDAPGHKEYIKNMITGASKADIAVVVVAANEGIKEQTRRHLFLLKLIGIKNIIVVVTKMDLVAYSEKIYNFVTEQCSDYMKECDLKPIAFIPISSAEGENILHKSQKQEWYEGNSLLGSFDDYQMKNVEKTGLIFPIQDIYSDNESNYIVGRVEAGRVRENDDILILPAKKETKIVSIWQWKKVIEEANQGECIGLRLGNMSNVKRGDIITNKNSGLKVGKYFKALIFWLHDVASNDIGDKLKIEIATQSSTCTIKETHRKIDSSTLKELPLDAPMLYLTEVGEVSIETQEPIVFGNFSNNATLGKFVLLKDDEIVAGGIIL
ncbi:MAG: GTP-binding protein [Candidatus Peregrinibacteria bacterium]|nr:GTP-binding protein [Candidatus Peregrinibacteria bacterium]MDZ4245451.1 GTP-binding protein [Candidatus Gracilibacteria bacterium]